MSLTKSIELAAALAASLLLSGCYELEEKIVEVGDYAPIAGNYRCSDMSGKVASDEISQISSGVIFKDYSYRSADGSLMNLSKIEDRRYVAQVEAKGKINVAFIEVNDNGFTLLIPDMMQHGDRIEQFALESDIRLTKTMDMTVSVGGDKKKVLSFFKAHRTSLLINMATCRKT